MNCPLVFALGNVIGFSHFLQFSEAQEHVERQHAVLHGPDTVLFLRRGGLSGECVRGELHIQNVNNRHSRLKGFIGVRRRIALKYLASYLRWYHLIVLNPDNSRDARYSLLVAISGLTGKNGIYSPYIQKRLFTGY